MADDNNPFEDEINFEAESDFGETKFDESTFPKEPKGAPGKGPLIVGGLLAAILIWQLVGFFAGDSSSDDLAPVGQVPFGAADDDMGDVDPLDSIPSPEQARGGSKAPAEPAAPVVKEAPEPAHQQSAGNIDEMEEKINQLNARFDRIERMLQQESVQDNKTARTVDVIPEQLGDVSKSIDKLVNEIKNLHEPPKREVSANKMTRTEHATPVWRVHAIIPGRAWLKNSDGNTITVIEGDKLELYGTVIAIDAGQGTVVTSSGIILR